MKKLQEAFYNYNFKDNEQYLTIANNYYNYKELKKGDIIFVSNYKYSNSKKGKYHLFLIINKYGIYTHGMLISSRTDKEWYKYNIYIKKDLENKLKKDSLIKTDYIYIIEKEYIINKIGTVNKTILNKCLNLNKIIKT